MPHWSVWAIVFLAFQVLRIKYTPRMVEKYENKGFKIWIFLLSDGWLLIKLVCQLVYRFVILLAYTHIHSRTIGHTYIWEHVYSRTTGHTFGNTYSRTTGHIHRNTYIQDHRTYTHMGTHIYIVGLQDTPPISKVCRAPLQQQNPFTAYIHLLVQAMLDSYTNKAFFIIRQLASICALALPILRTQKLPKVKKKDLVSVIRQQRFLFLFQSQFQSLSFSI